MQAFDEKEIIFPEPLPVCLSNNFCLMKIKSVELDGTGKLFYKNERGVENELTDNLMYAQFMLATINDGLKQLFKTSIPEPWIN